MQLYKNIAANILSQAYIAIIGIIVLPFLLKTLGIEAFGLISFYYLLQSIFMLLDLGLSGSLSRDTARFKANEIHSTELLDLLKSLEALFLILSILISIFFQTKSEWLSNEWLKAESLEKETIIFCLKIMGLIISMRLISSLYRSVINGLEHQVLLSKLNFIFATLRFPGSVVALILIENSINSYFIYQLILAFVEIIVLYFTSYYFLPRKNNHIWNKINWIPLKKSIRFSIGLSVLTISWVIFTQLDKLIVSNMVSLSEYGYFSTATTLAGGLLLINGPIGTALIPKLILLYSKKEFNEVALLYSKITNITSILIFPIAATMALLPEMVLWAWTGDRVIVEHSALLLSIYSIGNAMIAMSGFPFYLQYAQGNLSLNIMGNIFFSILTIILVFILTKQLGLLGAGLAWLFISTLYFTFWVAFVHKLLLPGTHFTWLFYKILPPALISIVSAAIINQIEPLTIDRYYAFLFLFVSYVIILLFTLFSSALLRHKLISLTKQALIK